MKKYFFKKYHQIVTYEGELVISNKNGELHAEKNDVNLTLIQALAQEGVAKAVLELSPLHDDLIKISALEYVEQPNTNRNELFFEYLGLQHPIDFKLQKIFVLGAGGAGGTLVYLLAQFGFCNITVLDFDLVEFSDLEKTTVYDRDDIGKLKIDALSNKIHRNFGIQIETLNKKIRDEADLEQIILSIAPKLIANAIDPGPVHKLNLNRVCVRNKVPFVYMSYSYDQLFIGPFLIPGLTNCYESYNNEFKKSKENENGLLAYEKVNIIGLYHPSISFNINTLASIILKDIILFFYAELKMIASLNKLVSMSLVNMSGISLEMQCEENCMCQNIKLETHENDIQT